MPNAPDSRVEVHRLSSLIAILLVVVLTGCSQEDLLQRFSSPSDQASARSYIDRLRAGSFDEIEKALDPSMRTPHIRDTLERMVALMPAEEPTSVKLVGAQSFSASDAKTVNTTFEYGFGDKWVLANVAVREQKGTKTIVGMNVNPIPRSLEAQHRFTFLGKRTTHYAIFAAAVAAVVVTLYSLAICARTKFSKRWLWVLFILIGVGKLAVNWTTGEWELAPLSMQLFSASAMAPLYGPWTIAASLPLGAIAFLLYKRPRIKQSHETKLGSDAALGKF